MKKFFLLVAMTLATFSVMGAENKVQNMQTKNTVQIEQTDEILEKSDTLTNSVTFYGIGQLVVNNKHKALICVYDESLRLVIRTYDSINTQLPAGTYYVMSDKKIKRRYVNQ